MRAGGDFYVRPAFQRRHRDLAPKRGQRKRDRDFTIKIVLVALKDGMFFDVEHLVRYISTLTTLEPGDLILTGSPKLMNGAPAPAVALKPGDNVSVSIDGLGELANPLEEEAG